MLLQPDQFQSRVYVRLPFTDKYLENETEAKKVRAELKRYFANPIVIRTITPIESNDIEFKYLKDSTDQ